MKTRVEQVRMTPSMKKIVDDAVMLRTSALCRDEEGDLILPDAIDMSEIQEDDIVNDRSLAIVAILHYWSTNFTKTQLAALRNGHE